MRRVAAYVLALALVVPLALLGGPSALAEGDVEWRIAEFWKRIDALGPSDLLSATDLGQWGLNVIERDPFARVSVADFRSSTAQMQGVIEKAGRVVPPAAPNVAVERRIADFWRRIDAMVANERLAAGDLGQWALNVTDRDPGARIAVAVFRTATAGMQAAIDRAGKAPVSYLPPTTSWVKTGAFPVVGVYSGVAVDQTRPGHISLFVENVGVVWTRDNGVTWRNIWCVNPHQTLKVALDPVDSDYLHMSQPKQACVADLGRGVKVREVPSGGLTNGSLIAHGARMYLVTESGIVWTADQWRTTQSLATPGVPGALSALAIDPSAPNVMYIGTYFTPERPGKTPSSGVYKSVDGGKSWTHSGLASEDIRALTIDPRAPGSLYALTVDSTGFGDSAIFKTTDGGATWSRLSVGGRDRGFNVIHFSGSGMFYVGTRDDGVYRSSDGGATWANHRLSTVGPKVSTYPASYRDFVTAFASSPAEPGKVYVTTADGLFTISGDQPSLMRVELPNGPSGLNADSWVATGWSDVAAAPSDPAVVYAVDRCGQDAYRSIDGGTTWQPIGPAGSGLANLRDGYVADPREQTKATGSHTYGMRVVVDARDSQRIWLSANGGLFSSSDGGTNWTRTSFKDPLGSYPGCANCYLDSGHMHGLAISPTGTLYAGLTAESAYAPRGTSEGPGGYVFKSTDRGATWTESSRGIPAPASTSMYAMTASKSDPNVLYFGTNRHDWGIRFNAISLGVYRSADAGASWSAAGLKDQDIEALALDPKDPLVIYAGTRQGLFKSTSGGAAWTLLPGAQPGIGAATGTHAVAVHPSDPSIVLAGFMGQGLYVSRDAGQSWSVVNADLKDVIAISISGRIVYAATKYNGIYRGPLP